MQLQGGWTMLTVDRVRSMCYRCLSQGLDARESDRMQAQLLSSVLSETMQQRGREQEILQSAAERSADIRSKDIKAGEDDSRGAGSGKAGVPLVELDGAICGQTERLAAIDHVVSRLESHL